MFRLNVEEVPGNDVDVLVEDVDGYVLCTTVDGEGVSCELAEVGDCDIRGWICEIIAERTSGFTEDFDA